MTMKRKIKVGITGAGMTVPWFLEAAELIPEMEIGALFARKEEKRKELCEKYHIPAAYDSYEKLLADESLDVLYLPLPNSLHYSFAKQALEAGKHLIMEKPFTVTYAEAKELAELAESKGLLLFEAVTNQYNPNYEKVRELLPGLGDIKIVQIDFAQYSSRYDAFKQGIIAPVFDRAGKSHLDRQMRVILMPEKTVVPSGNIVKRTGAERHGRCVRLMKTYVFYHGLRAVIPDIAGIRPQIFFFNRHAYFPFFR